MIGHLTDEYLREMGHTDDGDIYGIVSEILALRAQNTELVAALEDRITRSLRSSRGMTNDSSEWMSSTCSRRPRRRRATAREREMSDHD